MNLLVLGLYCEWVMLTFPVALPPTILPLISGAIILAGCHGGPPKASHEAAPNPVAVKQPVQFDGSASNFLVDQAADRKWH